MLQKFHFQQLEALSLLEIKYKWTNFHIGCACMYYNVSILQQQFAYAKWGLIIYSTAQGLSCIFFVSPEKKRWKLALGKKEIDSWLEQITRPNIFLSLRPRIPPFDEFYAVRKRQSTNFKTPILGNVWSGNKTQYHKEEKSNTGFVHARSKPLALLGNSLTEAEAEAASPALYCYCMLLLLLLHSCQISADVWNCTQRQSWQREQGREEFFKVNLLEIPNAHT